MAVKGRAAVEKKKSSLSEVKTLDKHIQSLAVLLSAGADTLPHAIQQPTEL